MACWLGQAVHQEIWNEGSSALATPQCQRGTIWREDTALAQDTWFSMLLVRSLNGDFLNHNQKGNIQNAKAWGD